VAYYLLYNSANTKGYEVDEGVSSRKVSWVEEEALFFNLYHFIRKGGRDG
jgi:hypothetical protein